jgi:hypothetical protein
MNQQLISIILSIIMFLHTLVIFDEIYAFKVKNFSKEIIKCKFYKYKNIYNKENFLNLLHYSEFFSSK